MSRENVEVVREVVSLMDFAGTHRHWDRERAFAGVGLAAEESGDS